MIGIEHFKSASLGVMREELDNDELKLVSHKAEKDKLLTLLGGKPELRQMGDSREIHCDLKMHTCRNTETQANTYEYEMALDWNFPYCPRHRRDSCSEIVVWHSAKSDCLFPGMRIFIFGVILVPSAPLGR